MIDDSKTDNQPDQEVSNEASENENIVLLHDAYSESVRQFKHLKKKLDAAGAQEKFWAQVLQFREKRWNAHLADLLNRNKEIIETLDDKLKLLLRKMDEASRYESKEALRSFPRLFERKCTECGIEIDKSSRHPKYRVCKSFIEIEVLKPSIQVKIFNRESSAITIPCDVDALIERVEAEQKRLFGRKFTAAKFIASLSRDYEEILKKEKLPEEAGVSLRKITRRRGKNVKGFKADEFLVDLSRLISEGVIEFKGRRLDLQQTKDSQAGMLLIGQEAKGMVGTILLRKMGNY